MAQSAATAIGADQSVPSPARSDDYQLVAVFDNNSGAHLARDALLASGIPSTSIHVIERGESRSVGAQSSADERRASVLKAIGSLFLRSETPAQFHLAEDPSHALLVLDRGPSLDRTRANQILAATGPVEIYRCT